VSHLLSSFETWIAALVHENALLSPVDRTRHATFIVVRLAISLVALAAVPLVLAFSDAPAIWEMLAFGFLMLPLAAVAVLSWTGKMIAAQAICLVGLVGLSLSIAVGSGGLSAAALAWLMLVPFEAVFTLSVAMVIVSGTAALVAVFSLVGLDSVGVFANAAQGSALTAALFVAPAVAYAAGLAYAGIRLHNLGRDEERRGAARYYDLARTVGDLVLHHDRGGAVLFASRESEILFGLPSRELMGRGFFERIHVGDRPAFLKTIAEAARSSETITATLRLRRSSAASGQGQFDEPVFVWVEMRARRQGGLENDGGDREGAVVAVVRDVTRVKLREEEIERARLDALRANAWKDRFLANLSHELRTPLNAIIGFSELLGNAELCPNEPVKQREYAGIIHISGQHLLAVVNSLLDMSKIEAGSFDILPEPFELPPLIDMCCDMVSLKAMESGVELIRVYPAKLDELVADKRSVKQILINLLSNAVKFTPSRGKVTVGVRPQGNSLAIYVADTGIGILSHDLPRLGDPFFQARDSYDRPYEGTGLGLSIVRGLVGLHGGTMAVESAPGEGTCVTVRLPLDCRRAVAQRGQSAKIEVMPRRAQATFLDDPRETGVKKIA
jgi:cell cycle sensor histidine kinase DivJ